MKITNMGFMQRFNEEPLLLSPNVIAPIEHLIADSEREARDPGAVPFDEMCAAAYGFSVTDRTKPFVFSNGMAFIPVQGLLLHRYNYAWEGATGYEYIRQRFDAALADPDVKGIVFDVNSPGGQVAGNFELADHIAANNTKKPMMALVDNAAYSGGYSLASAVGRVVAAPSGGVGSIGVVMMHVSVSRLYEKSGVDVSLIFAGKHKVDGSPFRELTDAARARFQASVDTSYDNFVSLVSRNRKMKAEDVRATEALTYDAPEAKRLGLVDAVQEPLAALRSFRDEVFGSTTSGGGNAMSESTTPEVVEPTASSDDPTTTEPPQETPAMTDVNQKDRIKTILSCEAAQGRRTLAEHIAFNTDMSVDDAAAMLAAAPTEQTQAAAPDNAFQNAMARDNPGLDAGSDAGGQNTEESPGDRIARTYRQSQGE